MTTMSPRTRSGHAFPGGRHMRRALKRLNMRRTGTQSGKAADHGHNEPGKPGAKLAGSMKA